MSTLVLGRQVSAGRMLAGLTQRELARAAGLHVNSIRYLERQNRIRADYSRERVEAAMRSLGVLFFREPTPGVRLAPGDANP